MANVLGDLVVRIVGDNAQFAATVDDSEKRFKKLGETLAKVGKQLTMAVTLPIVALGVAAVKSFSDQEAASKRLATALNTVGGHSAGAQKRLEDYSTALMKTTGVADELITNLISQAIFMGRTEEEAKKLAQTAVDIAATGIMPLDAAFETLQVTYEGIGIRSKELRAFTGDLTEEQLRAGKAVDILSVAVAGTGAKMRATTEGGLKALKTSLGELGETIGATLAPAINRLVSTVTSIVDRFTAMDQGTQKIILVIAGAAAAIGPLLLGLGKLIPMMEAVKVAILTTSWASMATGIGLAVAAIAILTAGIVTYVTAMRDAKKETADLTAQFPELNKRIFALAPTEVSGRVAVINARLAELNKILKEAAESPFIATDKQRKNLEEARKEVAKLNAELKTLQSGTEALRIMSIGATDDAIAARNRLQEVEADSHELAMAAFAEELGAWAFSIGAVDDAIAARNRLQEVEADSHELVMDYTDEESAARKKAADEEERRAETVRDAWISTAREMVTALASLAQTLADARIAEIDRELEAALAAAGLQEETTLDRLRTELTAAIEAGDAESEAKIRRQIERETAIEAINEDFDKKRRKVIHDAAVAAKAFAIVQAIIDTAVSVIAMLKLGPAGIPLSIAAGVVGAIQTAVIAAQPVPELAAGGIAMPRNGGVTATVAEAGQPEAIIPLDRLNEVFSRWPGVSTDGGGDIHLQVNMDSRPILEKIFPATRNRLVLIDAGAVV